MPAHGALQAGILEQGVAPPSASIWGPLNPNVDAGSCTLSWRQIQPDAWGQFTWDLLDAMVNAWRSAGKGYVHRFPTLARNSGYVGSPNATPPWILNATGQSAGPVTSAAGSATGPAYIPGTALPSATTAWSPSMGGARWIVDNDKAVFPVPWDAAFLTAYRDFLIAVGQRYGKDGPTKFLFVQSCSGLGGEGVLQAPKGYWDVVGYSGNDALMGNPSFNLGTQTPYNDLLWSNVIKQICLIHVQVFRPLNIPVIILPGGSQISGTGGVAWLSNYMTTWCIANGIWMENNGLTAAVAPYSAQLNASGIATGLVYQEGAVLTVKAGDASAVDQEISNLLNTTGTIFSPYRTEVTAATVGSPTYDAAWDAALARAATQLQALKAWRGLSA